MQRERSRALLCSTAMLFCADMAAAQTSASSSGGGLEEVVVTARRREESLQRTPVSISAYTANDLAARQIDNISQISNSTPNLVFNASAPISGSKVAASVFIRGIGQTDFAPVTDPGVGIYLDGVYIARSVGGVLDLVDIDRVEVLRGPQGTLFGKNTIGGAINITSRKPSNTFQGSIEVKTGTDARADVRASVDIPLSPYLSSTITYAEFHQDGYVKNLGGGSELGDTNARAGRVLLDFHPNDRFNALLSADWTWRREQPQAQRIVAFNPNAGAPTFGPFNGALAGVLHVTPYDSRFLQGGPFVTYQGANPLARSDLGLQGTALTASYEFDSVTLKSISAYRHYKTLLGRDSDNSPFTIVETLDKMDHHQISQELQLYGDAFDQRLSWLVGGYYFHEKGSDLNLVRTTVLDIKSGGGIDNDSYAGFAHLSYKLTDRLRVTGGARFTRESKEFLPDQQVLFNPYTQSVFGGAGFTNGQRILPYVPVTRDFNNFSGMVGLDYTIQDDWLVYGSFSQGFKSGGFNQRVFPPRPIPGSYAPEKANVFEVGSKWSNPAHTLRVNGALFYTEYKDVQVKIIDVVAPGLGNAAKGEIFGGELELEALPMPDLLLQAGAGYLFTRYSEFSKTFDPTQGIRLGNHFVNSPKWSLNASAEYTVHLAYGALVLRADASYRAKTYSDAANSEAIAQGPLVLVNAGVTWSNPGNDWRVALQVRNLTDRTYFMTGNDEFNGFGYTERVYARPREWSLSVKKSF
jgi:iron complex outermembrane recepter protein